jgi:hypothetical protein
MFDGNRVNLLFESSSVMASLRGQSLNRTRLKPSALRNTEIGQGEVLLVFRDVVRILDFCVSHVV